MKAKVTWVVIANGAHARIAMNAGVGKGLKPAMSREFAAPHVPNRRLVSDRPGRHPVHEHDPPPCVVPSFRLVRGLQGRPDGAVVPTQRRPDQAFPG